MKTVAHLFEARLGRCTSQTYLGIVRDSFNDPTHAIRRQGRIEWLQVRYGEVDVFPAGGRNGSDRCGCRRIDGRYS
jgi:hypothetical protein